MARSTVRSFFGNTGNLRRLAFLASAVLLSSCSHDGTPITSETEKPSLYVIGPGDSLQIFVWHNPDLTVTIPVRPDGRVSIPLVEDVDAAGKTPAELEHDVQKRLEQFVKDPHVTVIVSNFIGPYSRQVRVVGEAAQPAALPFRSHMSVMDAMISVGGLTQFASGNRAKLIRTVDGKQTTFGLKLDDLLKDGDISANVDLQPGDVIIIPQSYF